MSTSQDRLRRIFEAAIDLPPAKRAAAIDALTPGCPELRGQLLLLLAHLGDASTARRSSAEEVRPPISSAEHHSRDAPEEIPGSIGPYRVLELIGRGGFGAVYRAATTVGLRQLVAVKVLHTTLGSPNAARRFRREAEILRRLHHPSIAGYFDAGVEAERPYVVMELVEGLGLAEHCDRNRLSISERLRLFEMVCEAVQHAHQHLVVHRDLKPSNILVTAEGVPKLVDFGIATFTLDDLDVELATVGAERPVTPEYASPEQLRGAHVNDVTVDVYALGVILYELLSGQRPYELHGTRSLNAMAELIEGARPLPPSTRAAGDGPAAERGPSSSSASAQPRATRAAATRGTTPEHLRRILRGDLDAIVLKAIRTEPHRRYPNVAALLDDLRRHRLGLPVLARPDGAMYPVAKFLRRHRLSLLAGVLVLTTVLTSLVFAWRSARADADAAREAAEYARRSLAMEAERREQSRKLLELFSIQAMGSGGSIRVRAAIAQLSTLLLEWMSSRPESIPGLERDYLLAATSALHLAAKSFPSWGGVDPRILEDALAQGERVSQAWSEHGGVHVDDQAQDIRLRTTLDTARARLQLRKAQSGVGVSAGDSRALEAARASALEISTGAVSRVQSLVLASPDCDVAVEALLEALVTRSDVVRGVAESDPALDQLRAEACRRIEAELARVRSRSSDAWEGRSSASLRAAIARAHVCLGLRAEDLARRAGEDSTKQRELALEQYTTALKIRELLASGDVTSQEALMELRDAYRWVLRVERDLGRLESASRNFQRYRRLHEQLRVPEPDLEWALSDLCSVHELGARLDHSRQAWASAEQQFDLAIKLLEAAIAIGPPQSTSLSLRRARLLSDLALMLHGSRGPNAVARRDQGLAAWEELERLGGAASEGDRTTRVDPLRRWRAEEMEGAREE
jgi:serine/threonine protein kinase